jgi:hypothetical protein
MRFVVSSILAAVASLAPSAIAQTGVIDQVSPQSSSASAWFNGDATSLTWQCQARAGLSGTLEGFTVYLTGPQNATIDVALRVGPGWNTGPAAYTTTLTKPTAGTDAMFVNVTSANVAVTSGTLFVIELHGLGTGCGIEGTYIAPASGSPLYPEPLFLNGPGCFADCGWRISFTTYVLQGAGSGFCFGDGSGTACPCGNNSPVGGFAGCLNSAGTGSRLVPTGNASIASDTVTLGASGLPGPVPTLFFQGTARVNGGAGIAFGDGLRCVGGTIIRLGVHAGVGGVATYPQGADLPVSQRGFCVAGNTYHYQAWYRNAAAFCTSSTFNLSNGTSVLWNP